MPITSDTAPTMQTFEVEIERTTGTMPQLVRAAYFQTDGDFISFKDSDHKVVFHVRAVCVLSITRTAS